MTSVLKGFRREGKSGSDTGGGVHGQVLERMELEGVSRGMDSARWWVCDSRSGLCWGTE